MPAETVWVEFTVNNSAPEMIGETVSGLANCAALNEKPASYGGARNGRVFTSP